MIEVRECKTKKEQRDFVNFPLKLYKNNPYFVPPLYGDEKAIFKKDYMYYDQAEAVYFNAYKDGKIVGRISGIWQKAANEKWGQSRARFTRFDAVDDQDVANALFAAVEDWAKQKGLQEIVGPLGFSDLEREGLLIDGFDQLSTFEEQYNADYYQRLVENCGYTKDVDWLERQLRIPEGGIDPRIGEMSNKMLEKYNLHFDDCKSTKELLDRYVEKIYRIWDETYDKIYGTVPFTDKVKKQMLSNFKLVIDERFISLIVDENDNVVALGVVFPSMAKAVQKSGGRLTPSCIVKVLHSIKKPKVVELAIIGVVEEYKNKGISTALIAKFAEKFQDMEIDYAETNLTLEYNCPIQNLWKHFDAKIHKRRRCYIKPLQNAEQQANTECNA